jgi:hypothetical protein
VTRRVWLIAAVGAVLAAGTFAAFALVQPSSSSAFRTSPSWGIYSDAQWRVVESGLARRGLVTNVRVAAAMPPLALVAGTASSGRTCLVVVTAMRLGRTICRSTKPIQLFTSRHGALLDVVGIARHDVAGVTIASTSNGRPLIQGMPLLSVPGFLVFASGVRDPSLLLARAAGNRIVARVRLTAS